MSAMANDNYGQMFTVLDSHSTALNEWCYTAAGEGPACRSQQNLLRV